MDVAQEGVRYLESFLIIIVIAIFNFKGLLLVRACGLETIVEVYPGESPPVVLTVSHS